jgi:EAL domain-containing protein (putative c-di-GMP-specific phosphodiesterase class I)
MNAPAGRPETAARILIVDDNAAFLRTLGRMVDGLGYEIELCSHGEEADRALAKGSYDVVVSDIDMPELGGMELLRRARERDPDLPVILITGCPQLATAVGAVQDGAFRYLQKPLKRQELRDITQSAVRSRVEARAARAAVQMAGGIEQLVTSRDDRSAAFDRALRTMRVAYQPIVSWARRAVYGYEALMRSSEPSLPHPGVVIAAAEKLGRVHDLGRRIRELAIQPMREAPERGYLFVNLHPDDLLDEELFAGDGPLAPHASRVVLEITERASLHHVSDLEQRIERLRAMKFRIAIDDLGAGYAGLTSFAQLEPEVTKVDMSLVRDVHLHRTKQTLARTLLSMCEGLGIQVVAEGIETVQERDALAAAGFDLMQGYLFAKPAPAFPEPAFP